MLTSVRQMILLHTETCNPACTDLLMNSDNKPGQSDLLCWSKSVGVMRHFQASWPWQCMDCLLVLSRLINCFAFA